MSAGSGQRWPPRPTPPRPTPGPGWSPERDRTVRGGARRVTPDLRASLRCLAEALPPGSAVPVPREVLLELVTSQKGAEPTVSPVAAPVTWRERLWTCPGDTRLGVRELAEALGRPRSWVYRAVAGKREAKRLPAFRFPATAR